MKILLIRLRLIGDVVFTTPAVSAIRRRFPDAHITYLVESHAAPVVQHNPHLDKVAIAERPRGLARLAYDVALARQLRAERFDLVIDFHGGPRSAWLARASGAPERIGYALPGRKWLYTTRIPWTRALVPPRHSVAAQWDLLAPLGIPRADRSRDPIDVAEDPTVRRSVESRLRAAGVPRSSPLVVMHVSAGNPFRRWPPERFAAVAATLGRQDRTRRIVITSGPSDGNAADRIAADAQRQAGPAAEAIVRCGEFDLAELRALAGLAALYIGGDSGPLHIASATTTPIVALFGPTLPDRSMPWRAESIPAIAVDAGPLPCRPCHQRHCVPGDFRCLTMIKTEQVVDAASALLSRG